MELENLWNRVRGEVEAFLEGFLPPEDRKPTLLSRAVRYAVFSGGKRIRPLLVYLGYELGSGVYPSGNGEVVRTASAIELIHTFTLVHDDLPALDNDRYRRGKPTVHVEFGEDVAILAGDALFAYAFDLLSEVDRRVQKIIVNSLEAVLEGQVLDLREEIETVEEVLLVHRYKTGELMRASLLSGYTLADGDNPDVVEDIAYRFGKIFQITDDIIDAAEGKVEKASIIRFMDTDRAMGLVEEELATALKLIDESFGDRGVLLKELFKVVAYRER